MEVYILDSLLRRDKVVDKFKSLIWTERFSAVGDFELVMVSTRENRSLFTTGMRLAINESNRIMTVETVENAVNPSGDALLTIKGRSLEALLEDRVALVPEALTTDPGIKWTLSGTPGDIARQIFTDICGPASPVFAEDVIPYVTTGTLYPTDTIAEPTDVIDIELEIQSVYTAIKNICDLNDLGFRLIRNPETSALYFNVYSGSNRTTKQSGLPAVVFSPELDNLQNTTELTTTATLKNVAYVITPVGVEIVFAPGTPTDVSGFERRVLYVYPTDVTIDTPDISAALIQKGKDALSANRSFVAFDGEISQDSSYKYDIHYSLGDLVEIRNADGLVNIMRVTEQIFASDNTGDRSYPTLAINISIDPGTWLAWDYAQVWSDLGATVYWEDQV